MRADQAVSALSLGLRLADAKQVVPGADEDHAAGDGGSGHAGFAHGIRRELLILWSVLDHEDFAVFAGKVNLAVSRDGRRAIASTFGADALVIDTLAAPGVIAGDDSIVRAGVEEIAVDQRCRHRPLTAALHRPRNLRTRARAFGQGDVAVRAEPNGVERLDHRHAV